MCGVIGIIKKDGDVAGELLLGMNLIQHRGQDACGIITACGNEIYSKRQKGMVDDLLLNIDMSELKGSMGICHTRYPTAGGLQNGDTQPFRVNSTKKVSMAHNGNITNYLELGNILKEHGVFLSSFVGIEPVIKIFAYEYEKHNDFFKAAEEIMRRVEGSYSVVGTIGEKGIFAFRDPYGIRPLLMGKKEGSFIFASESVVLQTLGFEYVRDVEAGEAILISEDKVGIAKEQFIVQSKIIDQRNIAHCMFEWIYFARPDSIIEEKAVYSARLELGKAIASRMDPKDVDIVIPVPDSGRSSAIGIAEGLGVKYREGIVKNRYVGRTFIMPTQELREQSVSIKLNPVISEIQGKSIVVVDDSIVRGTTSKRIIDMIRKAKPRKVTFVSICPPVKYPCFYGVDFLTEDELIASNKTIEEIREYIGADELIFGTIQDVESVIGKPLCYACLNGRYPTMIKQEQIDHMKNDNRNNRC